MINGTMKNNAMMNKLLVPIIPILIIKLPTLIINDTDMSLLVTTKFSNTLFILNPLLIMPNF